MQQLREAFPDQWALWPGAAFRQSPRIKTAAFQGLRKKASAGVDGVTYEEYERDVAGNLQALHERLRNGKYQAQPLRRVYIPKENGKERRSLRFLQRPRGMREPHRRIQERRE